MCVENCACLSCSKKIYEYTGNSEQNCLQGLWQTISLDQLVRGKNGFKRTAGKQLFCKPKSYVLLSPRTVRLAIRKQYFDRYKSHSRPLRASLPISGLRREIQTIGRLVPWKLQCVEKKRYQVLAGFKVINTLKAKLDQTNFLLLYCILNSVFWKLAHWMEA